MSYSPCPKRVDMAKEFQISTFQYLYFNSTHGQVLLFHPLTLISSLTQILILHSHTVSKHPGCTANPQVAIMGILAFTTAWNWQFFYIQLYSIFHSLSSWNYLAHCPLLCSNLLWCCKGDNYYYCSFSCHHS